MRRGSSVNAEAPGQDAFLDVVCNLVGIMVVLVMVVAAHAKSVIIAEGARQAPAEVPDVRSAQQDARNVEAGLFDLQQRIRRQQFEIAYRNAERDQIQKLVLLAEDELARRQAQMSDGDKTRLVLAQQVQAAQAELARVELSLKASTKAPPSAIPHLPTPMATTVFTKEEHYRLLGGKLTYVPFNEMVELMQANAEQKIHRLASAPRIEEVLPVVQGFSGRYILRRLDADAASKAGPTRQSIIELERLWLVDAEKNLGEPLSSALAAGSQFRARLAGLDRGRTVITVWVYPDSFEDFRTLKAELFKLGFLTAARPLPEGVPIGGAPDGNRSSAE